MHHEVPALVHDDSHAHSLVAEALGYSGDGVLRGVGRGMQGARPLGSPPPRDMRAGAPPAASGPSATCLVADDGKVVPNQAVVLQGPRLAAHARRSKLRDASTAAGWAFGRRFSGASKPPENSSRRIPPPAAWPVPAQSTAPPCRLRAHGHAWRLAPSCIPCNPLPGPPPSTPCTRQCWPLERAGRSRARPGSSARRPTNGLQHDGAPVRIKASTAADSPRASGHAPCGLERPAGTAAPADSGAPHLSSTSGRRQGPPWRPAGP